MSIIWIMFMTENFAAGHPIIIAPMSRCLQSFDWFVESAMFALFFFAPPPAPLSASKTELPLIVFNDPLSIRAYKISISSFQ